jgi:hypothetical protein
MADAKYTIENELKGPGLKRLQTDLEEQRQYGAGQKGAVRPCKRPEVDNDPP